MKLRFTARAIENINDISDYLFERNPSAARRVRTDIYTGLQNLLLFPSAGRQQDIEGVRKLVTRKYAYLIYYTADHALDELVILNVKHPAQDRDFDDA